MKKDTFSSMTWEMHDGTKVLLPKSEGEGLMVSAFQSRAFGFGLPYLDEEELEMVNEHRRGKKYADKDAAEEVLGKAEKDDLESDPLVREFSYGNAEGKQGYWNYNHIVIQMEDVVDVLSVLHPDYDICFLFDHSSGHTTGPAGRSQHHRNESQVRWRPTHPPR